MRRLALELLQRQPAAFADLVDGEFANPNEQPDPVKVNSIYVLFLCMLTECIGFQSNCLKATPNQTNLQFSM